MTYNFSQARHELRKARVYAALGKPTDSKSIKINRDRLLQLLGSNSMASGASFAQMNDDEIETVVSIATATVEDSPEDLVVVLLICVKILAEDGQFARTALIARSLEIVARRFKITRPYWSLAVSAFSHALTGYRAQALDELSKGLGIGRTGNSKNRQPCEEQQLEDIICAAAMHDCLTNDDMDFAFEIRERALERGDALALAFLDSVISWASAAYEAKPAAVLSRADPVFARETLAKYVAGIPTSALFPAQIFAINAGITRDKTKIVALPTSSGKTLLAELRIIAALARHNNTHAIYVAPYRLLCRQVERQLRPGLERAGLSIRDLGGGYDPSKIPEGKAADVLVCTPERLDGLLRLANSGADGSNEVAAIFRRCSILVFDELHLIGRPGRGPRFELLLARLKMRHPELQLLGLAAGAHGAHELSEWLGDDTNLTVAGRPTGTLELVWQTNGEVEERRHRAQPSKVLEIPRDSGSAIENAADLMLQFTDEYLPVLAICTQRQRAENLAKRVAAGCMSQAANWRRSFTSGQLQKVSDAIQEIQIIMGEAHPLAKMMFCGVAFHHAGVPTHALEQIENLAREGLLRYVCATTTVAEGADLPFKIVVIPHLDFPGPSKRLERDLYLNIIGRAGRVNVSVEGMVFVLNSNAHSLKNVVKGSLWGTAARDVLRGKLDEISAAPGSVEEWNDYASVESQVLAWLADPSSYIEHQAFEFSRRTFTVYEGGKAEEHNVRILFDTILQELERKGYAISGSPLTVTSKGNLAQLTGLSMPTVARLEGSVNQADLGWLKGLNEVNRITVDVADKISRTLFEAPEVFQHGLWFRRNARGKSQWATLEKFAYENDSKHFGSNDYELDIRLFAHWILGESYRELAEKADVAPHKAALFGGSDESKRISDATEYIGKLTYPAAWVWSGVMILAGEVGTRFPPFIRGAIEQGVPTETAVRLIERGRLSRPAAMVVSELAGSDWSHAVHWIADDENVADSKLQLTNGDRERLFRFSAAIKLELNVSGPRGI